MKKLLTLSAFLLFSGLAIAQQRTLVIDAGHGGSDQGAIAPTGISEQFINLQLAQALQTEATKNGWNVVMTRNTTEEGPTLEARAAIRNKYKKDAVFISIHGNAAEDMSKNGMQIHYDAANAASKAVAERMQSTFTKEQPSIGDKDAIVLKNSSIPAIIVEPGYVTNMVELQIMTTKGEQIQFAQRLLEALK